MSPHECPTHFQLRTKFSFRNLVRLLGTSPAFGFVTHGLTQAAAPLRDRTSELPWVKMRLIGKEVATEETNYDRTVGRVCQDPLPFRSL